MASFQVSFSDMFDNMQTYNLREGGDKIPVTLSNRKVHSFSSSISTCTCSSTVCIRDNLKFEHTCTCTIEFLSLHVTPVHDIVFTCTCTVYIHVHVYVCAKSSTGYLR